MTSLYLGSFPSTSETNINLIPIHAYCFLNSIYVVVHVASSGLYRLEFTRTWTFFFFFAVGTVFFSFRSGSYISSGCGTSSILERWVQHRYAGYRGLRTDWISCNMQVIYHKKINWTTLEHKRSTNTKWQLQINIFLNNNIQVYEPADFWSLVLRVRTST